MTAERGARVAARSALLASLIVRPRTASAGAARDAINGALLLALRDGGDAVRDLHHMSAHAVRQSARRRLVLGGPTLSDSERSELERYA